MKTGDVEFLLDREVAEPVMQALRSAIQKTTPWVA